MNAKSPDLRPLSTSETAAKPDAIAIIGMAGRYPGGANSPEQLWQTLKSGLDAVTEAKGDRWDISWHHPDAKRAGRVYTTAGGYLDRIDGFDADFFGLSPREVRQVDPQQRLLLELAWEAHEDAGLAPRGRAGSDTGVFVGISSNDYASLVGNSWPDAYSNTGSAFSIAANRISYIFDFHGPSVAVDTACSSSMVCVHQACCAILAGECTTALAGGVSILAHIRPWLGFAKASMLSPTGRCNSFDASGDGYVRSEGGGLVLLKKLTDAERDGDRILGVILASGVNSDGRTMGLSMPNGDAQEKLLRKVYAQANVKPEDVFYVEAHGTGTAVGDPIECGALGRVLGAPRTDGTNCLIGSVKSNIGHLEAASGIAGLTKVLLALKHREVPGNLHFDNPNPKIDFDAWKLQVVTTPTPMPATEKPLIVGVNSFGFGGTNAHVVIREYRPAAVAKAPAVASSQPGLLVLNGNSEAGLRSVAAQYVERLRAAPETWADLCAAAATSRSPLRFRLAVVATDADDAVAKLAQFIDGKPTTRLATGSAAAATVPVAFVFSGNGPQWWGMGRELMAENAVFRAEIEAIDAIFAPLAGWSLVEEMQRPEAESRITLTEIAQPMLFAQQMAITKVLEAAGVRPAAVLGHSVGEAAAAYASGALTREQATKVIFYRSTEQAKTAGHGKMAAISISPDAAREAIAKIDGWLELAAINSPSSGTVAGDLADLTTFVDAMTQDGKFARVLPLNYAFHTKAMDPIRDALITSLTGLTPAAAAVPFVSTVDGTTKPGTELDADYWFRNVREPVQFNEAVQHVLKQCEIQLFIEIGPHPVLKDYVSQCAKAIDMPAVALQSLRRPGRQGPEPESDNIWTAVSAVYANGGGDLASLYARPNPLVALPTYPWQHERHWRGGTALPEAYSPLKREHALLGYRVPSHDGLWENGLDTHQLPFLMDHVVQDAVVFPAAGYIELALTAAGLTLDAGAHEIETFEILRPLVIPAHADPFIQTAVDAKDGTFEIRSCADRDTAQWTTHARGRLSRSEPTTTTVDLSAIDATMESTVDFDTHYHDSAERGLKYGPFFQGVQSVRLTPPDAATRAALAIIRIDGLDVATYRSHPSLLDSCVQVLITLIGQNEVRKCSTIPVQIGQIRSVAPLTNDMRCHVVMRRESARSAVADFRITDAAGNLLMAIDGARCSKVDFTAAGPTPLTSEWWRPDPAGIATAAPAALPSPSFIKASVDESVAALCDQAGRAAFYETIRPRFNALVAAYAVRAIAGLQAEPASFDLPSLSRQGKVKRDRAALLATLVRFAEESNALRRDAGRWHWNATTVTESPEHIWKELFAAHPRYQAELLTLSAVGDSLPARLKGDDEDAASTQADLLRDTSPFQLVYNHIARAAVEALVKDWPANRPLRILEIAGGAGGLSSWLLPALPPERTDYLFTDPSDAAVARAEHRLHSHRFARFATLDLHRDFAEQGVSPASFDLIVGANAFGSEKEPAALLTRLKSVLASGGQLLAVESNQDRFADLVFGHGLGVSVDDLTAAGFVNAVAIDDAVACPAGQSPQQSVLLAGIGAVATVTPSTTAATEAKRWLLVTEPQATALCQTVADRLTAFGHTSAVKTFTADTEDARKAIVAAAFSEVVPDEVVIVAGRNEIGSDLLNTQRTRSLTALAVVHSIETLRQDRPCRLTLVSRGAFQTANGQGPIDPGQASLYGLDRVIGNEHSGINPRMIDLHNTTDDAASLADELLRHDAETEVQWSAGHRYVNRERLTTLADEARNAGRSSKEFALDFEASGGLDSLYLRLLDCKTHTTRWITSPASSPARRS